MTRTREADECVLLSVRRLISALQQQGFFGTLELKFEGGAVVLLRKTENIKPSSYRDNRDQTNAGHQS
jgi:hypothetical protein